MNRHPIELVMPLFHWLDWIIAEYGLYIYLVAIWASPFLIAWILSGGFWRKRPRRHIVVVMPRSSAVPPPLPPSTEASPQSRRSADGDIQSFAD